MSDAAWGTGGGLDRRQFLSAGGALVAGAGLAGAGLPQLARAAAAGPSLSARRGATYRALVGALAHAPEGRFRHRDPVRAARAFADWYAGQEPAVRRHADAVLDELAPLLAGSRTDAARYAAIAEPPGGAAPDAAQARARAALMAAVAIAEPGRGGEDDRAPLDAVA